MAASPLTRSRAFRLARKLAAFVAKDNPRLLPIAQQLVTGLDPIQFGRGKRSVYLWGKLYFLSGDQAECMRYLVDAYKQKTPEVDAGWIELRINPGKDNFKLAHIWRDHPLWGTRIQPGETRGSVRLVPPEEQIKQTGLSKD